jgi:hypothetical protein
MKHSNVVIWYKTPLKNSQELTGQYSRLRLHVRYHPFVTYTTTILDLHAAIVLLQIEPSIWIWKTWIVTPAYQV